MNAYELAFATQAIAAAICDGKLPNRLNHKPEAINLTAVMPVNLIEANIRAGDCDGSRPMAEVETLLYETWPEYFVAKKETQREIQLQLFHSRDQVRRGGVVSRPAVQPRRRA